MEQEEEKKLETTPVVEPPKVEEPIVENVEDEDVEDEDDSKFIKSLLEEDEDEESEEEEAKRRKNKDAEEARKRRAAEAKAKREAEEAAKAAEDKKSDVVDDKAKEEDTKHDQDVNKLGEQLVSFKRKYPDVDLAQLDQDKLFKRFIDGKLLGKRDFTTLYEEFVEFSAELKGVDKAIVEKNHLKAQASSKSSASKSEATEDVYSEEELAKISNKLPFMSRSEMAKIEAKVNRSIAFYDKIK